MTELPNFAPRVATRSAPVTLLLAVALLAGGCGASVKELQAPRQDLKVTNLAVVQEPATAVVSNEDLSLFRQRLTAALRDAGFDIGSGMTLSYRFVEYAPGNQRGALLGAAGVGRGSGTVEVTYSREGETVAVVRVTRELSGGDRSDDLGDLARAVAGYTGKHFK